MISAESIYHCMLLYLDHILYRRAHFVRDAQSASRAVLAIMSMWTAVVRGSLGSHVGEPSSLPRMVRWFSPGFFVFHQSLMNDRLDISEILERAVKSKKKTNKTKESIYRNLLTSRCYSSGKLG